MRLAFRCAALSGNGQLVSDLIDTQCAGTTLDLNSYKDSETPTLDFELLEPVAAEQVITPALQLGAALADVAAAAGIPVALPPRLTDGDRIVLADFITYAEHRYGRSVRDQRVLAL